MIKSISFHNIVFISLIIGFSPAHSSEFDKAPMISVEVPSPELAFLFFPGAKVEPEAYLSLAKKIQDRMPFPTNIYIAKFSLNIPNPIQGKKILRNIKKKLFGKSDSKKSSRRVFLLGHSQGGIAASQVLHGPTETEGVCGLVLLGSYLAETPIVGDDLRTFPLPTLTLGGELDGLTGINFIAREFRKMLSLSLEEQILKPVILLEGQNHMQFADGSWLKGDLPTEKKLEAAHDSTSKIVANFIDVVISDSKNEVPSHEIMNSLQKTERKLNALIKAPEFDKNLCIDSQKEVSGLDENYWKKIRVEPMVYQKKSRYASFVFSKSSIRKIDDGKNFEISVPSFIEKRLNLMDVSLNQPLSPETIACKMRSKESIKKATRWPSRSETTSCAELNLKSLKIASKLLTPEQVERFERKFGRLDLDYFEKRHDIPKNIFKIETNIMNITDKVHGRGEKWAFGSIPKLKFADGKWHLKTYSLKTSTKAIGNFGGAFYCKIIPVSRFVEWLLLFSHKGHT